MNQSTRDNHDGASPVTDWWEQYWGESRHQVCAFVRSFAPEPGRHERNRKLIDGLRSAANRGLIDGYEVTVVGDSLCCCEHCRSLTEAEDLLDSVTSLHEWSHHGLTSSGFGMRTVESSITGDQHRVLVPPEISFGIYIDDSLKGVFPCAGEDETYQPEAYLDDLRSVRVNSSGEETVTHIL